MKLVPAVALSAFLASITCIINGQGPFGPGFGGMGPHGMGSDRSREPFAPPMMVPVPEPGSHMSGGARFAPPAYVAGLSTYAHESAKEAGWFLDAAKRVPIRSKQQGEEMAAIRALHNSVKQYANATTSTYWPRPDWLRYCSENLLDAWIRVDQSLPILQQSPPVIECWNRAQAAMVALYNAAAPHIGATSHRPLPLALGRGTDVAAAGESRVSQKTVENLSVWDLIHLTGPEAKPQQPPTRQEGNPASQTK